MEDVANEANNKLKPLKYPGLGLFMTFKIIFEIIVYIIQCTWRGVLFVFKDIPIMIWQRLSGKVDEAYRGTQAALQKEAKPKEATAPKKSVLNMDLNDLLKNTSFMKKKFEKLEKEKVKLLEELQGPGKIRSKEAKVYKFTAKNKEGKLETGIISGLSKLDINTFLVQDGYDVYKIENNQYIDFLYGQKSILAPKLKTKDLLFWLTQLSTYLKSGITLAESIRILNLQNKKPTYKRAFQSVIYELTMGEPFSAALEKQGTMFPPLLINMIKAAEATGELQETLDDMANYYEEIDRTHKQMVSAMSYPTVIMIFSLAVITFILVWVIPDFLEIYESAGAQIQGLTAVVISVSVFLQNNLATVLLVIILIITILVICYKKIKAFRVKAQTLGMKLPVIGDIIIYNEMAIFSKTFSSLLRNNVFITESIDILSKITNNEIYKEIMYNTINNVVNGEKISLAFKDHWAVPDVAYYMIVTGESTGQLAEMMGKVSTYYQEMHRNIINNMKSFVEPILICFLAVIVGVIIISVIVPMFELMSQIKQ